MNSARTTSRSDDLLLASEVADIFRVSVRTISRWGQSGYLPPPIRVGGIQRWRRSDIDRMLQEPSDDK